HETGAPAGARAIPQLGWPLTADHRIDHRYLAVAGPCRHPVIHARGLARLDGHGDRDGRIHGALRDGMTLEVTVLRIPPGPFQPLELFGAAGPLVHAAAVSHTHVD